MQTDLKGEIVGLPLTKNGRWLKNCSGENTRKENWFISALKEKRKCSENLISNSSSQLCVYLCALSVQALDI